MHATDRVAVKRVDLEGEEGSSERKRNVGCPGSCAKSVPSLALRAARADSLTARFIPADRRIVGTVTTSSGMSHGVHRPARTRCEVRAAHRIA
eukprot:810325-Rhodomonas_salina.2